MKAAWWSDMMWGRMEESLFARIMVIILEEKFNWLMGW